MSSKPILEVKNLHTYFRTAQGVARAVDGISFSIHPGETYALVGESGCGKSVTALSIMGLIPAPAGYIESGTIHFDGRDLVTLSRPDLRAIRGNRISMVFQEPMTALNPVFTVGNQIAEVLILHRRVSVAEARRQGIEMLDRVGIPDPDRRFDEYPFQMSGGMRQRVMIAIALACRPALLIADEPTTALDVTIQSQILELMRDLREDFGTAIMLITHDMGVVSEQADRVGVMYGGRIIEEASRSDLFSSAAHPYTQMLMRALPGHGDRDRSLQTIPGMVPPATAFPPGCRFHSRCPIAGDKCRGEAPIRKRVASEHTVECFLVGENGRADLSGAIELRGSPRQGPAEAEPDRLAIRDLKMHFPIQKGFFRRTVGHVRAVDGLSLTIRPLETVGLVGESGCGKTTVGKCLVKLLEPTAGTVSFEGRDLAPLRGRTMKPYRRRIQMIFQDPFSCLDPRRKIGDTIMEGIVTHRLGTSKRDRDDRLARIMQRCGLDATMADRYPHEFSGGQRQRVGMARALAVEPSLVVCDEATSSLDVSVQAQILNLLEELQADMGLSYLFISHDLSVVRYLADRVAVMYLGRIVEIGETEAVIGSPIHPYTRALIAAVPRIGEDRRKRIVLPGDVPSPADPPPGCPFHPRCEFATDACRKTVPALEPMDAATPGREVACLRKHELPAG